MASDDGHSSTSKNSLFSFTPVFVIFLLFVLHFKILFPTFLNQAFRLKPVAMASGLMEENKGKNVEEVYTQMGGCIAKR